MRNDYYPFGARHVRSDYSQLASNRYKYNGKEVQVTGDLKYLDYGARMGDLALGRWFSMDPLSEDYLSLSPYHFSGNNPLINLDVNGMDYWSTSNPALISAFFNSLRSGSGVHDFSGWDYASNAEFTGNLRYNDETHKYYTYYGTERNGVAVCIGLSFDANLLPVVGTFPYAGAFVREPLSGFWQNLGYYTSIGGYDTYPGIVGEWNVNREGRLTGVESIKLVGPDVGMGKGSLLNAGKAGTQANKAINSIVNLSSRARKLALKLKMNINSPVSQQVLNNLDLSVDAFISKFRKSSIRRVMPGEYLNMTVEDALRKGNSTVSKLLTDSRFSKL